MRGRPRWPWRSRTSSSAWRKPAPPTTACCRATPLTRLYRQGRGYRPPRKPLLADGLRGFTKWPVGSMRRTHYGYADWLTGEPLAREDSPMFAATKTACTITLAQFMADAGTVEITIDDQTL